MSGKILVAYATRANSTREIAEIVGQILNNAGMLTETLPIKQIRSIVDYDAIVLGTAVRFGMLMPEMVRFVRKHKVALAQCPVAAFSVCLSIKKETPEHHITAEQYLDPIRREVALVSEGCFAGTMDYAHLGLFARFIVKKMVQSPEGNFINRDEVGAWAQGLVECLQPNMTRETSVEKPTAVNP